MMDYKVMILMKKYKSQGIGLLLTGILGSLGLFYSSITGGIIMLLIEFISGYLYVQYILDAYKKYYLPNYHLGEFVVLLIAFRIISFIITYSSIKKYNDNIDQEILNLSEANEENEKKIEIAKQLEDANEYVNSDSKKDIKTGAIIVVISFAVIMAIILGLSNYNSANTLTQTMEVPQPTDIENHHTYQIKADTAWIYFNPSENEKSEHGYLKNMIFESIKERNGFIYVHGIDNKSERVVYGWLKLSDLDNLSGCMH